MKMSENQKPVRTKHCWVCHKDIGWFEMEHMCKGVMAPNKDFKCDPQGSKICPLCGADMVLNKSGYLQSK